MARRKATRRPYVFTPARRAALAKARAVRSANAKGRRKSAAPGKRRIYSSNPVSRGIGVSGARKNFVPYARVNQRSQTAGYNVGTILPGTGKRVVTGAYVRLENIKRGGVITSALNKRIPHGSLAGKARRYFNENVTVSNPAIRADVGRNQARLNTSRSGGATITVRRGKHKVPQKLSKKGINTYDLRMKAIQHKQINKKKRRARRGGRSK